MAEEKRKPGRPRLPDENVKPGTLEQRERRRKRGREGSQQRVIADSLAENNSLRAYKNFLRSLDRRNKWFRKILSASELAGLFTRYQFDNTKKKVQVKAKNGTRAHRLAHFEKCGLRPDGDNCPLCGKMRLPNQFTWRIMINGKFSGVRTPPRCLNCQHEINKGLRDDPEEKERR